MELIEQQGHQPQHKMDAVDVDALLDDPELQRLHEARIAKLKQEVERRQEKIRKGHGSLQEITEGDLIEITTTSDMVVCHFFHRDFERCKIMDKHLTELARKYFDTRFIKLSAPDAPFFTVKLQVKVLPCVVMFKSGVTTGRVVGFDGLGATDDFHTETLEKELRKAGVAVIAQREEEEDPEPDVRSNIRKGGLTKTASDEDSDFE